MRVLPAKHGCSRMTTSPGSRKVVAARSRAPPPSRREDEVRRCRVEALAAVDVARQPVAQALVALRAAVHGARARLRGAARARCAAMRSSIGSEAGSGMPPVSMIGGLDGGGSWSLEPRRPRHLLRAQRERRLPVVGVLARVGRRLVGFPGTRRPCRAPAWCRVSRACRRCPSRRARRRRGSARGARATRAARWFHVGFALGAVIDVRGAVDGLLRRDQRCEPSSRRSGARCPSPPPRRRRTATTVLTRPMRSASSARTTRPGEEQLLRERRADDARQLRAADDEAVRRAREAERRVVGRDADVAVDRDERAAAVADAVDAAMSGLRNEATPAYVAAMPSLRPLPSMAATASFMSAPALKAVPEPVRIATWTSGSASSSPSAARDGSIQLAVEGVVLVGALHAHEPDVGRDLRADDLGHANDCSERESSVVGHSVVRCSARPFRIPVARAAESRTLRVPQPSPAVSPRHASRPLTC